MIFIVDIKKTVSEIVLKKLVQRNQKHHSTYFDVYLNLPFKSLFVNISYTF